MLRFIETVRSILLASVPSSLLLFAEAPLVPSIRARGTSTAAFVHSWPPTTGITMVSTRKQQRRGLVTSPSQPHAPAPLPPSKKARTRRASSKCSVVPKPIVQPGSRGDLDDDERRTGKQVLFDLRESDELVRARLICRPSKRNRSPYVADVYLLEEGREAIAHVPNLDMGGKCVGGVELLLRPARDPRTREKVRATDTSPKYGTPKCEFIAQLLRVDESELSRDVMSEQSKNLYPPTWVGAHPSLGERIAATLLEQNLVEGIPPVRHIDRQVRNPCGADNIRSDFVVTHHDGTRRVVEVKTVVDADYSTRALPPASSKLKCAFASDAWPYHRTAIFPWGSSNQKGPEGERVVSARAIHHVRELTKIASGELRGESDDEKWEATVLFVVVRDDVASFRPNHEACPSFARYLRNARDSGVQVVAKSVRWGSPCGGSNNDEGVCCCDDSILPIEWPEI